MSTDKKYSKYLLIVISILIFAYCAYRAAFISFTHDEALSFKLMEDKGYLDYTANNHLLNTWLMGCCAALFGKSELSLRLPNLLACALYLFFCSKFIMKSEGKVLSLFAIPLLFFNPFVLDFFVLARGYGLSLGFAAGALFFFLRNNFKDYNFGLFKRDFVFSMLFATLALFANLSLINFYISLVSLFIGQSILLFRKGVGRGPKQVAQTLIIGLIFLLPLVFNLKRLMILKEANDLYVGASSFDESVATFIERSSYFVAYPVWLTEILQSFIIFIFPIGLIITMIRRKLSGALFRLELLMLFILIGFWSEHYFFNTLFPIGRTGVYFILFFGLFIYLLFKQFSENLKSRRTLVTALGLIFVSLPLTFHFFKTVNVHYTFEWKYDARTKDVVMDLAAYRKPLSLGHNWIFGPSINYYIQTRKLEITAQKVEDHYEQDFVYDFKDRVKSPEWLVIWHFDDIGTVLYQNPSKAEYYLK